MNMVGLIEPVSDLSNVDDMSTWLSFSDSHQDVFPDPNWLTVYRTGQQEIGKGEWTLFQAYNIQARVVDRWWLSEVLHQDPVGLAPQWRQSPFEHGRRRDDELGEAVEFWEEIPSVTCVETALDGLVMDFTYDAPQLVPSFREYCDLVEVETRLFQPYDEEMDVAKFDVEKWKRIEKIDDAKDTVLDFKIRKSFLKDYLREKGGVLVLAHFQQRGVRSTPDSAELALPPEHGMRIEQGPAVVQTAPMVPSSEIHWICPLFPDDLGLSRADRLQTKRTDLRFQTHEGCLFAKDDVIHERGFVEAGFKRPAIGAESLEEAMGFFGFLSFVPEVLERYKRDDRGSVDEWSKEGLTITWLNQMHLPGYRNNTDEIVIILDDLKKIPDSELSHWHQHNVSPNGNVPEEMITNHIYADWVDTYSPSKALIEAMETADDAFQNITGDHLFYDTPSDIEGNLFVTPSRNQREELLEVMADVNQNLIENINKGAITDFIGDKQAMNIDGQKSALFELIQHQQDNETALRLIASFNAIYDFRQEESHRKVSKGGWERAMDALNRDADATDYREIYRDALLETSDSLNEIAELLRENR